jgi:hypothetical protein
VKENTEISMSGMVVVRLKCISGEYGGTIRLC